GVRRLKRVDWAVRWSEPIQRVSNSNTAENRPTAAGLGPRSHRPEYSGRCWVGDPSPGLGGRGCASPSLQLGDRKHLIPLRYSYGLERAYSLGRSVLSSSSIRASFLLDMLSDCRHDVLVDAKEIVRVVFP